MRDLYLRFADAEEMRLKLMGFGFQSDEDQGGFYHPEICLDVVGVISTVTGEDEAAVYATEPGFHVNIRVINDQLDLSGLSEFAVYPKTPARVWA
ncbi:hypothetical protein K9O81_18650 [Leclercia adecarboxylata]|uniref:hypothetical protein n=1 Tax=Leclercia adecarboxylata TaxID=83655 RepID=UPI001CC028C7|nr:hypothetical protein [Leclercia adecarboxylata]MBZ3802392.1 hypothetical protein [Leclercia adecarboxylata]MBZ3807028.1 hypothetical protein [Leclercia adecarboxylata]